MAQKSDTTVTLMSGGDIGPVYEPTEEFAELIAPVLRQADLRKPRRAHRSSRSRQRYAKVRSSIRGFRSALPPRSRRGSG